MPEEKLALVNEIADNDHLIVGFRDGSGSATVSDFTDNAEVGDIVKVEQRSINDDRAVEVVKKGGYERGRTIGVVEGVLTKRLQ